MTKPFGFRELTARVRAVTRRVLAAPVHSNVYEGHYLRADFSGVDVAVNGRPVRLTRREFQLLQCLVENRKRVMSRERLLDRVWGHGDPVDPRTVDVHLRRLRAKLGPASSQIETVVGLGYRFAEGDPR